MLANTEACTTTLSLPCVSPLEPSLFFKLLRFLSQPGNSIHAIHIKADNLTDLALRHASTRQMEDEQILQDRKHRRFLSFLSHNPDSPIQSLSSASSAPSLNLGTS